MTTQVQIMFTLLVICLMANGLRLNRMFMRRQRLTLLDAEQLGKLLRPLPLDLYRTRITD